jgi:ATP-dependent Clp endopeptidase proteolytic subunit ClpP
MTNKTEAEEQANLQKTIAEADAALANAEHHRAMAREADARTLTEQLAAREMAYSIEMAKIEARAAEIALAKVEREERLAKSADIYHMSYTFDTPVNDKTVKNCIKTLSTWSRDQPGCDIDLYINSSGGDIVEGFALIDFLVALRQRGHHIRTIALGMAASMGAVILQAGDERMIGKNAVMLIHEGSLGAAGSYGEVEDLLKLMEKLHARVYALFAERATPINEKTTVAFLKKQSKRTDWWLDSEEAIALGLIDSVL